jgi:CHASE2 domain-containing sensor protein
LTLKGIKEHKYFRPFVGAVLAVFVGLFLIQFSKTQDWIDASYDYIFLFSNSTSSNKVIVVQMDEASAQPQHLDTHRLSWNRAIHTRLLTNLTAAGAALVVFDVRFLSEKDPETDAAFLSAIRRNGRVVIAADFTGTQLKGSEGGEPVLPHVRFIEAATNWGIAKLYPAGAPIRMHTPPTPDEHLPTLSCVAATLRGAKVEEITDEMWIRYYGEGSGIELISYRFALEKQPEFFRDQVVFIGAAPRSKDPGAPEEDKFILPHSRWKANQAVGGVEILATQYLNLVNHDWLKRFPKVTEWLVIGLFGMMIGTALAMFCRRNAVLISLATAICLLIGSVGLSLATNYWFPWLILVGGQLPCALAWALFNPAPIKISAPAKVEKPAPDKTIRLSFPEEELPDAPEYEIITPEIGKGGFGKVWIARNAIGQWQALKAVYESSFNGNRGPYEAEFKGLQRYKPVSEKHPGLLRIDLVSKMKDKGYFYYVMELGDAQSPGWEKQPHLYKPRDLENLRKQAFERRLPPKECLRIVTVLADALNFLHQQGLTHRDIKPSNVIFVNGRPKLADVGLVADIRPADQVHTLVGTMGYMPPPPEKPGTPQADIYALGMLLYVISTGRDPGAFPDISTTLLERSNHVEFQKLNRIVLKACQPFVSERYQTTAEMLQDLKDTQ